MLHAWHISSCCTWRCVRRMRRTKLRNLYHIINVYYSYSQQIIRSRKSKLEYIWLNNTVFVKHKAIQQLIFRKGVETFIVIVIIFSEWICWLLCKRVLRLIVILGFWCLFYRRKSFAMLQARSCSLCERRTQAAGWCISVHNGVWNAGYSTNCRSRNRSVGYFDRRWWESRRFGSFLQPLSGLGSRCEGSGMGRPFRCRDHFCISQSALGNFR